MRHGYGHIFNCCALMFNETSSEICIPCLVGDIPRKLHVSDRAIEQILLHGAVAAAPVVLSGRYICQEFIMMQM